jgi:hypothetical protein
VIAVVGMWLVDSTIDFKRNYLCLNQVIKSLHRAIANIAPSTIIPRLAPALTAPLTITGLEDLAAAAPGVVVAVPVVTAVLRGLWLVTLVFLAPPYEGIPAGGVEAAGLLGLELAVTWEETWEETAGRTSGFFDEWTGGTAPPEGANDGGAWLVRKGVVVALYCVLNLAVSAGPPGMGQMVV